MAVSSSLNHHGHVYVLEIREKGSETDLQELWGQWGQMDRFQYSRQAVPWREGSEDGELSGEVGGSGIRWREG